MKTDRFIKDLAGRIDDLATGITAGNNNADSYGDEYYLARKEEPPRFYYYKHWRLKNSKDEWRKQTHEAVYDSITEDELDFHLKRKLLVPPEERYQHRKNKGGGIWHTCGMGHAGAECNTSCRFYLPDGRIEDQEIIEEHNELVESFRQRNEIVDIDISADNQDYLEFMKTCPSIIISYFGTIVRLLSGCFSKIWLVRYW